MVAAFADVVANTFNGFDAAGATVQANGAVATTSILFIAAAVGLGMLLRYARTGKWLNTLIAVVLLVACVGLGLAFPVYASTHFWHIFVSVSYTHLDVYKRQVLHCSCAPAHPPARANIKHSIAAHILRIIPVPPFSRRTRGASPIFYCNISLFAPSTPAFSLIPIIFTEA